MRSLWNFPEGKVQGRVGPTGVGCSLCRFYSSPFKFCNELFQSFVQISLAISKSETREKMAVEEKENQVTFG